MSSSATPMGQFTVTVTLLPNEGAGTGPRRVDALVDTGAAYTVVPRPLAESLGCRPHRAQAVRFAGGRVEEWPVAEVRVECEGRRATTTVLMGPAAGPVLMGAITLDGQRSSGIGDRRRSRGAVRRVCRPRRPLPGRRAAARDRSLPLLAMAVARTGRRRSSAASSSESLRPSTPCGRSRA